MKDAAENPNRLNVWGDSMLNKLKGLVRKRRKREASKKRREIERKDRDRSSDG